MMVNCYGYLSCLLFAQHLCFSSSDSPLPVTSRVCFVKFHESESVGVSQHLTNTVFVDRALIVVPFAEGECLERSQKLFRVGLFHRSANAKDFFFLIKQNDLECLAFQVCEREMFICVHVLQTSCKFLSLLFVLWFS